MRGETIRIVTKTLVVHTLELDAVIGLAAIRGRIEAERLAACRVPDEDGFHIDASQAIDEGFAGAARTGRCQDIDARQVEARQRLAIGEREAEPG